ncbi:Ethanolamine ammonia-lyase light chain [Tepidimonas alkaliphilus]|uniref:Ethanolamine ammonia-lyase small subunit n=1 Tax=Tepidimonas alkaliphilus TaxID=2588942 RepID=A0A554W7Y9_9BURK|nr:ethanolamine ammonia-lyase subunit EutC [Tepidimonas alkaliphilus]TSE19697.1 Ethanolamine ammonia-lyase light chain [Tepidimonas alkaliphilus]
MADKLIDSQIVPDEGKTPPSLNWSDLRRLTPARIGLKRTGSSLTTAEILRFDAAHAQARDAVHNPLDIDCLRQELVSSGWNNMITVRSQARDRSQYLLRPDLGRRLDLASRQLLEEYQLKSGRADVVFILADGLSSSGIQQHAPSLLFHIRQMIEREFVIAPLVIATQARVALGDEVGEVLQARMAVVIIGERPGLSSPDSIGLYMTFQPRVGCVDAQRNCISNIRPQGQQPNIAALRFAWLLREAFRLGATGVTLKDHSGLPLISGTSAQHCLGGTASATEAVLRS